MAITVKHKFVSAIPDGDDASVVRPSNWNDTHELTGLGTMAEQNANNVNITGGSITGVTIPAADVTGLGTMATQNASSVAITGGTLNGVAIGGTTAGDGAFDVLSSNAGNLNGTLGGTTPNTAAVTQLNLGSGQEIVWGNTLNNITGNDGSGYFLNTDGAFIIQQNGAGLPAGPFFAVDQYGSLGLGTLYANSYGTYARCITMDGDGVTDDILDFRNQGTQIGSIQVNVNDFTVASNTGAVKIISHTTGVMDNVAIGVHTASTANLTSANITGNNTTLSISNGAGSGNTNFNTVNNTTPADSAFEFLTNGVQNLIIADDVWTQQGTVGMSSGFFRIPSAAGNAGTPSASVPHTAPLFFNESTNTLNIYNPSTNTWLPYVTGAVTYAGTWNASTNTPTLTSSVGTKGQFYVVSVAGTTNLNGVTDWQIGDWAIFNGSVWQKVDNTDSVISVNGQTGAVSITLTGLGAGTIATQNANSVAITGGNIDGTTIGATTPAVITGSTINANTKVVSPDYYAQSITGGNLRTSGGTSLVNWDGGGSGNVTINGGLLANPSNKNVSLAPTGTGTVTINPATTGAMDNVVIGATTPVNGNFTNLAFTGTLKSNGSTGTTGQVLTSNGSGSPTWTTPTTGTVTSVTGTAPVVSSGGATPAISMPAATSSVNGYLTSTDWTTFNSKQPAGSYLTTVTADAPLTGSGTSGSHLSIPAATGSVNGYLTSTDWTTFNGKLTNPMSAVGDTIYGATSGTATRLAGNTTTAKQFLSQTGTGSASQAPAWSALPTVLPVLNRSGSTVSVSVGNGVLPVLNRSGSTINVAVQ